MADMENRELQDLQRRYIEESNAFLEGLRQGVSSELLARKIEKIKALSRLLDADKDKHSDPSGNPLRKTDR
jgi:hypothetical protein